MSVDKLVDSTQLDSDLTSVANAIRTKGGTSAQLAFPAGFVSAVQAIPTGTTPTGTKQISISQNGTTTEDVANYASAEIIVNVPSGGGSSGTVDSDYIELHYAIVTVGANTISNSAQVLPYLYGLAGITLTTKNQGWCCVIDHGAWHANMYVCTDIQNTLNGAGRKFYRYRNGAISSVGETSSYDAKLRSGDKYLVACLGRKGAPTV